MLQLSQNLSCLLLLLTAIITVSFNTKNIIYNVLTDSWPH